MITFKEMQKKPYITINGPDIVLYRVKNLHQKIVLWRNVFLQKQQENH